MSDETESVTVSERKFNATATYRVDATDKGVAKRAARRYFQEEYGHKPSYVVAVPEPMGDHFRVNVSDHSSGSLKSSHVYDL